MKRTDSRAAALALAAISAQPALGASYYFDSGFGGAGNGSAASPWSNLSNFNSLDLNPGDNVYLSGSFNIPGGGLSVTSEDAGTTANPVTIAGASGVKATLNAGDSFGLSASNVGGIKLESIRFLANGPTSRGGDGLYTNTFDGVRFYNNEGDKKQTVHINDVQVQGFGKNGIRIEGQNGASGFDDVRITNSLVQKNQVAGVSFEGDYAAANKSAFTNVYIGKVTAAENRGRANLPQEGNTGNGIVIGQVNGAVIERSVAHHNGLDCASEQGGAVGIWAWDSNGVIIQHNESYANGTAGEHDGGGFDLDGGVTDSIMQYNYSHDNDGAGYLLAQFENAREYSGNVIRYNISQNDGRKNGYGGIHSFGPITSADVYNNTVFMSPALKADLRSESDVPAAIKFRDGSTKNIRFFNNLLILTDEMGGADVDPSVFAIPDAFRNAGASGFSFLNNNYWMTDGSAMGNALDPQAMNLDPKLIAAGFGSQLDNADDLEALLDAYRLDDLSPLIDQGLDLSAYGIDMGLRDFYGLSRHGLNYDIGASESAAGGVFVPEPAGLALVALGAVGGLIRRRSRNSVGCGSAHRRLGLQRWCAEAHPTGA